MRLVREEKREEKDYWSGVTSFSDISDAGSTLGKILYGGKKPSSFIQVLTLIL